MDIAIDYIKKGEYTALPLGKHDIVGKDIWVSVIETGGEGPEVSYDENRDFGVVDCENANSSYMSPDDFYICMLDEPHKPACAAPGKAKAIKKCIFKFLV